MSVCVSILLFGPTFKCHLFLSKVPLPIQEKLIFAAANDHADCMVVSLSLSLSLCLCLCLSLSLSLYIALPPYLSPPLTFIVFLFSISLSLHLSFSPHLYFSLHLSFSLAPSFPIVFKVLLYLFFSLSICFYIAFLFCLSLLPN